MDIFSARLKWLREKKGMAQKDMAEKLQMSQSGYNKIENGRGEPNLSTLVNISEVLKETTDFLLGITDLDTVGIELYESFAAVKKMYLSQEKLIQLKHHDQGDTESMSESRKQVLSALETDFTYFLEKLNRHMEDIPYTKELDLTSNRIAQEAGIYTYHLPLGKNKKDTP